MTAHFETLLIVEDDAQIRNFIAYALKQEGFAYHTASAAQQAMEILISQKIDLMILDLGLPDFDGMEVIDKVRSWSEMPILVVSARDQDTEKAAALDAGADQAFLCNGADGAHTGDDPSSSQDDKNAGAAGAFGG